MKIDPQSRSIRPRRSAVGHLQRVSGGPTTGQMPTGTLRSRAEAPLTVLAFVVAGAYRYKGAFVAFGPEGSPIPASHPVSQSSRIARAASLSLVVGAACFIGLTGRDAALAVPVATPLPGVVFGNLGATGTNALDTGSWTTIGRDGSNEVRMAISFKTGPDGPWLLSDMLRLGLGNPTGSPAPFALIMADDAGSPSNPVAMYDGAAASVSTAGHYDFTKVFGGALTASTDYWLLVGDAGELSSFSWYANGVEGEATDANHSKWILAGTEISLDRGLTWAEYAAGGTAAFSIAVVPEPSTYCMALAGIACGGFSMWRRRKRA